MKLCQIKWKNALISTWLDINVNGAKVSRSQTVNHFALSLIIRTVMYNIWCTVSKHLKMSAKHGLNMYEYSFLSMQNRRCSIPADCSFKGKVSRDFLLLVFFINQFPPSPRVFRLNRSEFFRKFAEIFASQGAPPVAHWYQRHRWQIFLPFSRALLIPVANLPPVSTIPVANNGNNIRLQTP